MKKKEMLLSVLALIGLIVITTGVTFAFFNYAREGTTDNTVTTGSITFLYTETSGVGKGISLTDAFPISDEVGKQQVGEGNVFDFKVTSTTPNKTAIPYEITARKKSDSCLDESAVKVYLTKVNSDIEEEVLLDKYSNLTPTTKVDSAKYTEKTIYTGKVPANSTNYEQAFKLRMWIDEETNFSPNADGTYPYNGKTFTVTVNVYANAKIITDEDIALESSTNISSLSIGDSELTTVEGQDYNYETTLPEGTTSTTINIETENPGATVNVERLDSLAYSSNIKRLSTSKTLDLNPGDNYFKVSVTSENKEVTEEYKLKVTVATNLKNKILSTNTLIEAEPTLTTSSNNTSDASGLYKSTATNDGSPTYYFRGNVENNYIKFLDLDWRIVRINEDGTIRIIRSIGINGGETYKFQATNSNYSYMYYSNSNVKNILETWFNKYIKESSDKLATGNYFCEQAKVKFSSDYTSGDATMTVYSNYIPNFKCSKDGNGYGLVNSYFGLISYDEVVFAGGFYNHTNDNYYLYNNEYNWTMSPAGYYKSYGSLVWRVGAPGGIWDYGTVELFKLRAVLNLKTDTVVVGDGTSTNPYVVQ